jgi:hypothetical protein
MATLARSEAHPYRILWRPSERGLQQRDSAKHRLETLLSSTRFFLGGVVPDSRVETGSPFWMQPEHRLTLSGFLRWLWLK